MRVAPMLLSAGLASAIAIPSAAAAGEDLHGIWTRGDGNARVRIAPCGADICAINLWIADTSKGEAVGDRLVMSVTPKSATRLSGRAFDPKRDMTYSIDLTVSGRSLETRGCVVGGLLCRSVSWSKVD